MHKINSDPLRCSEEGRHPVRIAFWKKKLAMVWAIQLRKSRARL